MTEHSIVQRPKIETDASLQDAETALESARHQLREASKREQRLKGQLRTVRIELDEASQRQADLADQVPLLCISWIKGISAIFVLSK